MRLIYLLALLPAHALAWEFSPDPICTLSHDGDEARFEITFDAELPEYTLYVTPNEGGWDEAGSFQMAFRGGAPDLTIGTTRQELSPDARTLSVRDTGFGNVLDGIEFNAAVAASSGARTVVADTRDAAPAVQAFRACPSDIPATS